MEIILRSVFPQPTHPGRRQLCLGPAALGEQDAVRNGGSPTAVWKVPPAWGSPTSMKHSLAGWICVSAIGSVCTKNCNCLIWCWSLHTGAWSKPSPFTGGVAHILQHSIKSLGNCSSHMSLHSVPLAWHLQVSCFNFTVSYFCSLFLCHSFSLTILMQWLHTDMPLFELKSYIFK